MNEQQFAAFADETRQQRKAVEDETIRRAAGLAVAKELAAKSLVCNVCLDAKPNQVYAVVELNHARLSLQVCSLHAHDLLRDVLGQVEHAPELQWTHR